MKIFGWEIKKEGESKSSAIHRHIWGKPKQWVLDSGKVVTCPRCKKCGELKEK